MPTHVDPHTGYRFCAPEQLPVLSSVLFDLDDGVLTLVATDRYRLAMATVPASEGPAFAAVVPAGPADEIVATLGTAGAVEMTVQGATITVRAGGSEVHDQRAIGSDGARSVS